MKKILILILVLIIYNGLFGQIPTGYQYRRVNERIQGKFMIDSMFTNVRFADTTEANLHLGVDSCGEQIFTRDVNAIWIRNCNPKKWVRLAGFSEIPDTSNKWVNSISRTLGKDSIIFYIGGTRYAIKDSTGGGALNLSWDATNHEVDISGGGTSAVIPFATGSANGLMNTTTQTFSGFKTFNNEIQAYGEIYHLDPNGNITTTMGHETSGLNYGGSLVLKSLNGGSNSLLSAQTASNRTNRLPNVTGTLANSVTANSVNYTSDVNGVIDIGTIGGSNKVDSVTINTTRDSLFYWINGTKTLITTTVKYNFTDLSNGDLLKYDAASSSFINFKPYDTVALASFGGGGADAGDTASFATGNIYGSFYNTGSDTLVITNLRIGLQGTSPSVTVKIFWNDSLNVEAGATALVTAGSSATNIYTGTSVTSFDNTKIPPGVWVWCKTSAVTTKPTYMAVSLIGYKKRVYP